MSIPQVVPVSQATLRMDLNGQPMHLIGPDIPQPKSLDKKELGASVLTGTVLGSAIYGSQIGYLPSVATVATTLAGLYTQASAAVSSALVANGVLTTLGRATVVAPVVAAVTLYAASKLMYTTNVMTTYNTIRALGFFEFMTATTYGRDLDALRKAYLDKTTLEFWKVRWLTTEELQAHSGFTAVLQAVIDEHAAVAAADATTEARVDALTDARMQEKKRKDAYEKQGREAAAAEIKAARKATRPDLEEKGRKTDAKDSPSAPAGTPAESEEQITSRCMQAAYTKARDALKVEVAAEIANPRLEAANRLHKQLKDAAKAHDIDYGPTLNEILGDADAFIEKLKAKREALIAIDPEIPFTEDDITSIEALIAKFGNSKFTAFIRSNEFDLLLKLDKVIMDRNAEAKAKKDLIYAPFIKKDPITRPDGTALDMHPTEKEQGSITAENPEGTPRRLTAEEMSRQPSLQDFQFEACFSPKYFQLMLDPKNKEKFSAEAMKEVLGKLKPKDNGFDGKNGRPVMNAEDLQAFGGSPARQLFTFYLFNAATAKLAEGMDLSHMEDEVDGQPTFGLTPEYRSPMNYINEGLRRFVTTGLGNDEVRANTIIAQLKNSKTDVLVTQEVNEMLNNKLVTEQDFWDIEDQKPGNRGKDASGKTLRSDGSFAYLKKSRYTKPHVVKPAEPLVHDCFKTVKMPMVTTVDRQTGDAIFIAGIHGDSGDPTEGCLEFELIIEAYLLEARRTNNPNLQLWIAGDLNTKSDAAYAMFVKLAAARGVQVTRTGYCTIKGRLESVMFKKLLENVAAAGDVLMRDVTNKVSQLYSVISIQVGFSSTPRAKTDSTPSKETPSDHYAVTWVLKRVCRVTEVLPRLAWKIKGVFGKTAAAA